ncbi:MAG: NAD(P)-dependent alcohol dehydrogenase [Anaerolineae bacterium]|nr:NAD(P)-dependent alcohol dehydrogenase [Anaerolineae bacterium]
MKAIVWIKYGSPDVLQLREVAKPTPKANEVLVKIRTTTVTTGDCEMRRMQFPLWVRLPMRLYAGVRKPKRIPILGGYLAGDVVAVGETVQRFQVGDAVFGTVGFGFGSYAEYICVAEKAPIIIKPEKLRYEEVTAVSLGGLEALHFLRKAKIQPGEHVLINGAGGSIGTYGIQLAKQFGAEVTAVDSSHKLETLRAIGADHVIDYTQEDFTQNGQTYDVIFDIIGKSPFAGSMRVLRENGRYLIASPSGLMQFIRGKWASRHSKKVIFEMTNPQTADLEFLTELMEDGKLKTVIDKRYSLEQIPEAHRYVESGQKVGNVIINVAHDG